MARIQTPHRFRTKRQLWTYSGLGLETHDSAQYHAVEGQLQRSKKPPTVRGSNKDHNHDLKDILKGAATISASDAETNQDFWSEQDHSRSKSARSNGGLNAESNKDRHRAKEEIFLTQKWSSRFNYGRRCPDLISYPHRHRSIMRCTFPLRGAIRTYPVPRQ